MVHTSVVCRFWCFYYQVCLLRLHMYMQIQSFLIQKSHFSRGRASQQSVRGYVICKRETAVFWGYNNMSALLDSAAGNLYLGMLLPMIRHGV